jgi:Holliday junction resolvase RusA-like endonuclease
MAKRVLVVYDQPAPKPDPQVVRKDGRTYAFKPRRSEKSEWAIRQAWLGKFGTEPMMDGPLRMVVIAYFPHLAGTAKKWLGRLLPWRRPDCSNLLKQAEDALNKHAYKDDGQLVEIIVAKRYADMPRWEIAVEELSEKDLPGAPPLDVESLLGEETMPMTAYCSSCAKEVELAVTTHCSECSRPMIPLEARV